MSLVPPASFTPPATTRAGSSTSTTSLHPELRRGPALARRVVLGLIPLAGVTALVGCSEEETAAPSDGPPPNGAEVGVDTFAALLAVPGTVILDVRTPAEFAEGHLENARNIDVSAPGFRDEVAKLERSIPYAVYCRSGNRSAVAVAEMADLGFTATYHLAGGVGAWTSAGRDLVR